MIVPVSVEHTDHTFCSVVSVLDRRALILKVDTPRRGPENLIESARNPKMQQLSRLVDRDESISRQLTRIEADRQYRRMVKRIDVEQEHQTLGIDRQPRDSWSTIRRQGH